MFVVITQKGLGIETLFPKEAYGMAYCVDTDQIAPLGAVHALNRLILFNENFDSLR